MPIPWWMVFLEMEEEFNYLHLECNVIASSPPWHVPWMISMAGAESESSPLSATHSYSPVSKLIVPEIVSELSMVFLNVLCATCQRDNKGKAWIFGGSILCGEWQG